MAKLSLRQKNETDKQTAKAATLTTKFWHLVIPVALSNNTCRTL